MALCPHCGGAIALVPDRNPGAIGDAKQTQSSSQIRRKSDSDARIAQDFDLELQDQQPKSRTYNQGYDQDFLDFWSIYPAKRDKRKAQIAWRKSLKRLAQNGDAKSDAKARIIAGAIRYRDDPNRSDEFTKYAEGWLNGDCWDDEPLPFRLKSPNGNGQVEIRGYDYVDFGETAERLGGESWEKRRSRQ